VDDLRRLGHEYGIDLIVSGHRHIQGLFENGENGFSTTAGIPYLIAGGGGGITADGPPVDGRDMYGFMDMKLEKDNIFIQNYNHYGHVTITMNVKPRGPKEPLRQARAPPSAPVIPKATVDENSPTYNPYIQPPVTSVNAAKETAPAAAAATIQDPLLQSAAADPAQIAAAPVA